LCAPILNQQSSIANEPGLYIPIINQQSSIVNDKGGGVDISSPSWKKAWGQKQSFVKYRQNRG